MQAPPHLSKHPMLRKIEELSRDRETRKAIIDGIRAGGRPEERLTRIEQEGLMEPYGDAEGAERTRKGLLNGLWGDSQDLLRVSDALATALERVTDDKPLTTWWAPGATSGEITVAVHEGADAVYFMLLTKPMGPAMADKVAFDAGFLAELQEGAEELVRFTDRFDV
ncbi:MAG: hypothetical protein QNK05_25595 [Myxococcota bacterium]|nr:hypothetical protein [Myxococcota bacterium]